MALPWPSPSLQVIDSIGLAEISIRAARRNRPPHRWGHPTSAESDGVRIEGDDLAPRGPVPAPCRAAALPRPITGRPGTDNCQGLVRTRAQVTLPVPRPGHRRATARCDASTGPVA